MSPRTLKVYGGTSFARRIGQGQFRVIVATPSFAAAQRAVEDADLFKPNRDYWSTTGNATELEVALAQPGVVFARHIDDYHGKYVPVRPYAR